MFTPSGGSARGPISWLLTDTSFSKVQASARSTLNTETGGLRSLVYPCLYVGKTTNVRKRFSLHIKRDCPGRLHQAHPENVKAKPNTTSCQLRFGIEHVFPNEENPLNVIFKCVGFSHRTDFPDNAIAERFFEEDRLVGIWRPWFNIDSER